VARGRFSGARQKHVAHVLAIAGPQSLVELLDVVGGERKALERSLESLAQQGLVDAVDTNQAPAPGRPSRLWSLTTAGKDAIPNGRAGEIGQLSSGGIWVLVAVPPDQAIAIDDALVGGDLVGAASWVARLDGDGHSYMFAFDTTVGSQPVENLTRTLRTLGAQCITGTVREAKAVEEFLDVLRTAERVAGHRAGLGDA
jgi:hypothetical protein